MKFRFPGFPDLDRRIDAQVPDVPRHDVAAWCVENLRFDEAGNRGPFILDGHEYIAEVLNDWKRTDIADEVLVWGSQTRKTGTLMAGVAWALINDPTGFLWAMPSLTLAKRFSRQRFARFLRASRVTRHLIPLGRDRHSFSMLEMLLGGSTINFVGSNSAANLSSNPCRRVVLDEVDKFDRGGREEADAVNLAEQRTKDQPSPQRWKTSTPTTGDGLIWREYLKGDQRRLFLPCPACGQRIVLAWSRQFTVMKLLGSEAFIQWSPEAKRLDGTWDYERVERTAHALCPHCKAAISDAQKPEMIRRGEWQATTAAAAAGFVSRHLSSLYPVSPETSWGRLAVKFLQSRESVQGLQGFINGDLAEPYMSQDISRERLDLVTARIELGAEWMALMTVDCQAKSPLFWYVVRRWNGGNSRAVDAGHLDDWTEVRAKQLDHRVVDCGVFIDSGYGATGEGQVYQECARHSELKGSAGRILALGWMPVKGQPGRRRWPHPQSKLLVPWETRPVDPYHGFAEAARISLDLLKFSVDYFKDILDAMRRRQGGYEWAIEDGVASEEYWRHLDGEVKAVIRNRVTGASRWTWVERSPHWPNHLRDCEVLQLVGAAYLGLLQCEEPARISQTVVK